MARTDAVQFFLELAAEWRRLGAEVTFEPGWERRGNGTSPAYEGGVVHHTASASSATRPFPTRSVLISGRPGLSGPLCNVAGPWCPPDKPLLHIVAAYPANHAGASGGRSMGPLPTSSLFNRLVVGLETDYAGVVPMAPGQMRAALIFTRGLANVLRRSVEYIRAHMETSITGKWDPGYAEGRTYDMAAFRRAAAELQQEDDMPTAAEIAEAVWARPFSAAAPGVGPAVAGRFVQHAALMATRGAGFRVLRSDPAQNYNGVKGTGEMVLVAPGAMVPIPSPGHYDAYKVHGICGHEVLNLAPNWFAHYKALYEATMRQAAGQAVDLDTLAGKLAALVNEAEAQDLAAQAQAIAEATADELATRVRE